MMPPDLEIRPFTPELLPEVAQLLRFLWAADAQVNQQVFRWKYDENPHRASTAGVVALQAGRVVGFRGYFATAWTVPGRGEPIRILCPGDTCVDPASRQRGLSLSMAEVASRQFADQASLFLNTTATHASLPGYRRLGFLPLASKAYLSFYRPVALARYILAYRDRPAPGTVCVRRHAEPGFEVTSEPRPDEMAELALRPGAASTVLAPVRTAAYFRWRFRRPDAAYAFYYTYEASELRAYVVLGLSPNRRRGYVLDVLDGDGRSASALFERVLVRRDWDILSIATASLPSTTVDWRRLGGKSTGLLRRLERRRTGELPLLLRPLAATFEEDAWLIDGLDARELRNWGYREMVSDAF